MSPLEKELTDLRNATPQDSKQLYFDVSNRALVRMVGEESLDLLHRISTNEMLSLALGASRQTILTSEKGRMIELVSVYRQSKQELILAGSSHDPAILTHWISKFIIMEDVKVEPAKAPYIQILLSGDSSRIFNTLSPDSSSSMFTILEHWEKATWTRLVIPGPFDQITKGLKNAGFTPGSDDALEAARIADGIPCHPNEFVDFNPLEAGLKHLVSFSKGCYVGQEVIARLDTYEKVQRSLRRMRLSEIPSRLPAPIAFEREEAGILTSASGNPVIGLAYINRNFQDNESAFIVDGKIDAKIYPH
ncbi:MAG: GcvT-like aminomethyltransferase [Bacteroidetes bacterium]|nr:GcvT-like aminomethyltransferase [Bacteroidota bacterium]